MAVDYGRAFDFTYELEMELHPAPIEETCSKLSLGTVARHHDQGDQGQSKKKFTTRLGR